MECGDDRVTVGKGCYLDGVRDVLMAQFSSKNSTVFKWTVIVDSETIEEWKKLVGKLSFRSKISVIWVNFKADDPIHIFPLLDLLTPGYLEWIEISNSPDFIVPYQRLAETEQWKQARRAIVSNRGPSIQELSQYFYHFEDFIITVDDLTIEFMIELSNNLCDSPTFKTCSIESKLNFTAEELATAIGGTAVGEEYVLYSIDGMHDFLEFVGDSHPSSKNAKTVRIPQIQHHLPPGMHPVRGFGSKEPKKRTFMDLPVKLFNKISEDLKPVDRILLRQTCPAIESLVDNLPQKFERIVIGMEDRLSRTLILLGNQFVEYRPQPRGHFLKYNGIIHESYENDDLEEILYALESCFKSKNAKFEELKVTIEQGRVEDFKILIKKLIKKSTKINVTSLNFSAIGSGESLNLLRSLIQLMEPGDLEYIRILNAHGHVEYDELAETEQWKRAKTVKAQLNTWSTPGQLEHFLHFEEFEIEIRLLGVDSHFNGLIIKDLIDLKTNLQKSKNFKTCSIYGEPKFTAEQFAKAIGTVIREDKTIRDPIPDSKDFLEFKFPFAYSRYIRITRKNR
ncbi:unnamed protein product [Caenorhabditis brenneri]